MNRIRNQDDGETNFTSESPVFSGNGPIVYVRVRNKGYSTYGYSGLGSVKLYWSKAATASSWPSHWDGSQPAIGNLIGNKIIFALEPGESQILKFIGWTLPNPISTWNACLMARINIAGDPTTIYPNELHKDIKYNNNIIMRNVTIDNSHMVSPGPSQVAVGNITSAAKAYNLVFEVPGYTAAEGNIPDITADAAVKLSFDETGWNIIESTGQFDREGITKIGNREILITTPQLTFSNILFPAGTRVPITFSFTYATEAASGINYGYLLSQYAPGEPDSLIGRETFELRRLRDTAASRPGIYENAQVIGSADHKEALKGNIIVAPNPASEFAEFT